MFAHVTVMDLEKRVGQHRTALHQATQACNLPMASALLEAQAGATCEQPQWRGGGCRGNCPIYKAPILPPGSCASKFRVQSHACVRMHTPAYVRTYVRTHEGCLWACHEISTEKRV